MMPGPLQPVVFSLGVATMATLVTLAVGLAMARLLTYRHIHFQGFWETLIMLPMVFPPTITGYLLLLMLGKRGPVGALLSGIGVQVVFTRMAAVIAAVVVSLPLMYQNCKAALSSVDQRLIDAARTLGIDEGRLWRRVTIPLAAPGILSGVALSFARALGEFGATLMIAGNIPGRTQTIPLALYSAVEGSRSTEANVYLGITVALSFVVIGLVGIGERRARTLRGKGRITRHNDARPLFFTMGGASR
ncbi:MAG TPA: molybdate ABC transporter permease subunit [bacterium]|nr:molybdate ABC transporter permease subunit [bacterium]